MLAIIILLSLTLLTAYPISLRLAPAASWPFRLSLAWLLGSFVLTLELFVSRFLLGLQLGWWLWPVWILQIGLSWYACSVKVNLSRWPGRLRGWLQCWRRQPWWVWLLAAVLLLQLSLSAAMAYLKPVFAYDSLTMWSLKPQLLYVDQAAFFDRTHPNFFAAQGHANYPWQLPLQVWLVSWLNQGFDSAWLNYVYWLYYVALIVLVAQSLPNRRHGLMAATALSGLPLLSFHAWNAYVDLPLAVYGLAGLAVALHNPKPPKTALPALTWLLWLAAVWLKNEGIFFLLAGSLWYVGHWPGWKRLSRDWVWWSSWLAVLAWLLWLQLAKLGLSHSDGSFGFHPEVLPVIWAALFKGSSWGLTFFATLAYGLVLGIKTWRQPRLVFGWSWLAMVLGLWLGVYLFSPAFVYALDGTALYRNMLTWVPSLWLLLSMGLSQFYQTND